MQFPIIDEKKDAISSADSMRVRNQKLKNEVPFDKEKEYFC